MKTILILVALLSGFSAAAQTWYDTPKSAQAVKVKKVKLYRAIVLTGTGLGIDGILYELTDSTLRYVRNTTEAIAQLRAGQVPEVFEVSPEAIEKIVIRRKGHVGRGALFGAGLGVAGSIMLLLSLPPADSNIFVYIIRYLYVPAFPIGGAFYGSLFSIIPRRFKKVNRSMAAFQQVRVELLPFSYRFQENQQSVKPFAN